MTFSGYDLTLYDKSQNYEVTISDKEVFTKWICKYFDGLSIDEK